MFWTIMKNVVINMQKYNDLIKLDLFKSLLLNVNKFQLFLCAEIQPV